MVESLGTGSRGVHGRLRDSSMRKDSAPKPNVVAQIFDCTMQERLGTSCKRALFVLNGKPAELYIHVQSGCSSQASGVWRMDCGMVETGTIIQFCVPKKRSIKPADNIMKIRFMTI